MLVKWCRHIVWQTKDANDRPADDEREANRSYKQVQDDDDAFRASSVCGAPTLTHLIVCPAATTAATAAATHLRPRILNM